MPSAKRLLQHYRPTNGRALLAAVILRGSTINPTMDAMINLEDRAVRVRQITEGNHGRDGDVLGVDPVQNQQRIA